MEIKELAAQQKQYVIDLRRKFHMNPETGWNEIKTAQMIKDELDRMGIPHVTIAKTGVLATIRGKQNGRCVALRADMDALEIQEQGEKAYQSKNEGVSHACGHDAHVAMLLGAAGILNGMKDELDGTVKCIFQPAEESLNGAPAVIESGALDGVDSIFGLHIIGVLPTGLVGAGSGPIMSSADRFIIDVEGKGGHGGMPDQTVDAVVAASAIVMNLQTIASREIGSGDPIVISVGQFNAGTRFNIIAGSARLEGTTRCFKADIRENLPHIMERICSQTARAFRAETTLNYTKGVPPTVNEAASAARVRKLIRKTYGENSLVDLPPSTGGEDFSFYLEKIPGAFALLGGGNVEKGLLFPQHHEKFDIDEDALEIGTTLHVEYALDFLNEK